MPIRQLVGIAGPVGSGKDTLADALVSHCAYAKMAFAEPIKRMLRILPFMEEEYWKNRDWKEGVHPFYECSPRVMAQTLGTEWGRNLIHKNLWVSIADHEMKTEARKTATENFVFCDLRFPNEALWIRRAGGLVVHLKREGSGLKTRHVSESGFPFEIGDQVIYNEGTVAELQHNIWLLTARARTLMKDKEIREIANQPQH